MKFLYDSQPLTKTLSCLILFLPFFAKQTFAEKSAPPNVLMICIDDLNDWVGCMGGHPDAYTPNIDLLAERGTLFSNAHCQAPICVPSRTSLLTGTYPFNNGVYEVAQIWRKAPLMKDAITMPQYFRSNGYLSYGVGKVFHSANDDQKIAWDEYQKWDGWKFLAKSVGPEGASGLPKPGIFDFGETPLTEKEMPDYASSQFGENILSKQHDKPFFLAVGLNCPHLPLLTPTEYYNSFPQDEISLTNFLPGDVDDLPPMGLKFTRYFDKAKASHHNITRYGLWHKATASYLATAKFVDMCVGRLLKALDNGPNANNTIVILWSDHGFHLGEKDHWEKRSLWEESTRVPLIICMPGEKEKKARCTRSVGLIDLFPTLVELCNLPKKEGLEGRSLTPLIENASTEWPYPALTTQMPGNHSVRSEHWRYIRYINGDEELYDHKHDPHEYHNLANDPQYQNVKDEHAKWVPEKSVPQGPWRSEKAAQRFDWSKP